MRLFLILQKIENSAIVIGRLHFKLAQKLPIVYPEKESNYITSRQNCGNESIEAFMERPNFRTLVTPY